MGIRSFNIYDGCQGIIASVWEGLNVKVQLHKTVIFERKGKDIILSSGGWKTVSSKTAMNKCLSQLHINAFVYQKKGTWFVEMNSQLDSVQTIEFKDGMKIKGVSNV